MCKIPPAARRLCILAAGCFGVFFPAAAAVSMGCSWYIVRFLPLLAICGVWKPV